MRTEIQTFFGKWLELPPASVCKMGDSPASGTLGVTTIVGSRFWDCQLKFRIRLGPMSFAELQRMLPIGKSYRQLKCWVMNYVAEEFFWDMQLVLKAAEVPEISLGQAGLLGWTSWLKSVPFTRDADDVVLNPDGRLRLFPWLKSNAPALFGKLNSLAYKAIEGATIFCKMRGNPYVGARPLGAPDPATRRTPICTASSAIRARSLAARRRSHRRARQASARCDFDLRLLTASRRSGRTRLGLRVAPVR